MTLYRRQGARPSPRKRKAKWFSEKALQQLRKEKKLKAKEKRKDMPF